MACIITWNKDKWPEEKMQAIMDRFSNGESIVERWKCGAYKKFGIGDRVYLSKTGKHLPGLIGSGKIHSEPRQEPDFNEPSKYSWYVDIKFDFLAKSPTSIVISHNELESKLGVSKKTFTPQKSGYPFSGNDSELQNLWLKLTIGKKFVYPDEIDNKITDSFKEGAKKTVVVNRYERDKNARQKCIEFHGTSCSACEINLGLVYGPDLGKDYIHVHHIVPLSGIGEEYEIDPIEDLIPLCPNCHAMVHQFNPPLSVEALKEKIMPRYRDLFK